MSSVVKSEPVIDTCTELFMTRMGEYAEKGQSVDLATWAQWYAFDVIGALYFSSMFGFMRERSDHQDYIKSLDVLLPTLCATSVMPSYIRSLFLYLGLFLSSARRSLAALQNIEEASANCVKKRLCSEEEKPSAREDILGKLLSIHKNKGDVQCFNMTDIQTEVFVGL